jgi:hypothetical protein
MIMPLIFGAFGNFLLPTQLGVHDVAFPRLNSAAFWFLPAGLIMLCQLVCLDRRYQRMNCFNIREVESLLKSRFFPDLINSHDYRVLLTNTTLGLRFKLNDLGTIDNAFLLFNYYGIDKSSKLKTTSYEFLTNNTIIKNKIIKVLTQLELSAERLIFFFNLFKKISGGVYFDLQLLFYKICLDESENEGILRVGGYNIFELIAFFSTYVKTEFERQSFSYIYLLNLTKNSSEYLI